MQKIIRQTTLLLYLTVGLATIQSLLMEFLTTDSGHHILSIYFFIEAVILGLIIFLGLQNKRTRVLIALLISVEAVFFFLDKPISPDELLMMIIFGTRVYLLTRLFTKKANQYYSEIS